jgi:hypothetical protein
VVADDGLAAPALRVAARQVQRGVLLRVEEAGDEAEQLGGLMSAPLIPMVISVLYWVAELP